LQHRGRADEADTRFRQALHLAVALGDGELQARAAIGLGRRYPYWETDSDRIAALESALEALPPDAELLRLTVMGLLVTQMINGFHPEEAERRDELALKLAAVAVHDATEPELLLAIGRTRIYDCIEDPTELDGVAKRLVAVAADYSDLRVLAGARFSEALAALDTGHKSRLETASSRYGEVAEQLDDPRERSQAATVRATIAFIEGRYEESEASSYEALELGKASGDFNAELIFYAQGLLRAVDLGQVKDVLPLLLDATDYQRIPAFATGTVLCAALAGEHEMAGERLDELMRSGFEGKPRGADWLSSTTFLAQACTIIGSVEHAPALFDSLSNSGATVVRVGPLAGWWGPVDHHLGTLAILLGRLDIAEVHLRRAGQVEEAMAARPFAARTEAALAALLVRQGREGSDSAVTKARARASDVGAVGILSEIETTLGAALAGPGNHSGRQ
jgi:hypothetical protein